MPVRHQSAKHSTPLYSLEDMQKNVCQYVVAEPFLRERRQKSRLLRGQARWLVVLIVLAILVGANAQTSGSTSSPEAAETGTRAELLDLLQRVDNQLSEATTNGRQQDVNRLRELKVQFELLLLQAELEALQRQNAELLAQQNGSARISGSQGGAAAAPNQAGQANEPQGSTTTAVESEISGMRQQFTQLDEQQADVVAQLGKIADQHAILLDQLGSTTPDTSTRPTAEQPDGQASQLQQELSELQRRFTRLTAQQGVVNSRLKTITDDHAALLDQLASATPATSTQPASGQRIYVVRPGDSLSKLAKAYYGTGSRWLEILQANPFLSNPDQLFVGTELTIP